MSSSKVAKASTTEHEGSDIGEVELLLSSWPYNFDSSLGLRTSEIPILRHRYGIPDSFDILAPESGAAFSTAPPPGYHGFNISFLEMGVRLPLHPFLTDFLVQGRICPAQLVPNSWASLLAYIVMCRVILGIPLNLDLLYCFSQMRAQARTGTHYLAFDDNLKILDGLPTPHKGWTHRFFYISGLSSEIHRLCSSSRKSTLKRFWANLLVLILLTSFLTLFNIAAPTLLKGRVSKVKVN